MLVIGDLGTHAVLSLASQMTMMFNLHPPLQAHRDEQPDGDDTEMQKEILDAKLLSVGYVNVEHNILQINYWTSI